MEKIIKEGIVKNVFIIIAMVLLYFPIKNYFSNILFASDKIVLSNALTAISMISVIACFACFAFTYEKIKLNNYFSRYLAHFITGILLLVVGICLIIVDLLWDFLFGRFGIIDILLILLYLACIGYDFWDMMRVFN